MFVLPIPEDNLTVNDKPGSYLNQKKKKRKETVQGYCKVLKLDVNILFKEFLMKGFSVFWPRQNTTWMQPVML